MIQGDTNRQQPVRELKGTFMWAGCYVRTPCTLNVCITSRSQGTSVITGT